MALERMATPNPYDFLPPVLAFDVRSDDIAHGQPIPDEFAHAGGNQSPHLAWSGAPPSTESYVVTCFDPDAPIPSGFWHWVAVNIPASVTELPRGAGADDAALRAAAGSGALHVRSDFGSNAYGGPAPPAGDRVHRYYFVVHAVDTAELPVDAATSPAVVGFNLAFHTVGRAMLLATYHLP